MGAGRFGGGWEGEAVREGLRGQQGGEGVVLETQWGDRWARKGGRVRVGNRTASRRCRNFAETAGPREQCGKGRGSGEDPAHPKDSVEKGTFPSSFASDQRSSGMAPQGQSRGGGRSWRLGELRGAHALRRAGVTGVA